MNECTYKNYDELPLMLNVVQVASVLGISRAGAYGMPCISICGTLAAEVMKNTMITATT